MQRILELLGLSPAQAGAKARSVSVRHIVEELQALEPDRAQFLAAFAFLLGRVAHADLHVSTDETRAMERIVAENGDLPPDQARLVVEIVQAEHDLRGGTQSFQVAREFREISSRDERRELLHCLFAVSAADDEISGVEEKQIRQVAEELGFSHREYVEIRATYNDRRSVVRLAKSSRRDAYSRSRK
jgi:uncharacterized tellurite resistance protein B-like protein